MIIRDFFGMDENSPCDAAFPDTNGAISGNDAFDYSSLHVTNSEYFIHIKTCEHVMVSRARCCLVLLGETLNFKQTKGSGMAIN